jgi:type IV pilus assembly protein PilN
MLTTSDSGQETSDPQWNLSPWREKQRRQQRGNNMKYLIKAVFFAVCLVALAHAVFLLLLHIQDEANSRASEKIKKLQSSAGPVQQVQQQIQQLQTQMGVLQQLSTTRDQSLVLLNAVSKVIPDGIYLTKLSLQSQHVEMLGSAETMDQVQQLLKNMQQNPLFLQPRLQESNPVSNEAPYLYRFTIETALGNQ